MTEDAPLDEFEVCDAIFGDRETVPARARIADAGGLHIPSTAETKARRGGVEKCSGRLPLGPRWGRTLLFPYFFPFGMAGICLLSLGNVMPARPAAVGLYASLKLDSQDNPRVAYWAWGAKKLRYVVEIDPARTWDARSAPFLL